MLFLCFIGVRLETLASIAVFNRRLPSFVSVCYRLLLFVLIWSRILGTWQALLLVSYSLLAFAYVRFVLFECGGFSIRFVSVVVVCARSLPFAFVCLFCLRSCVALHRLLLGS